MSELKEFSVEFRNKNTSVLSTIMDGQLASMVLFAVLEGFPIDEEGEDGKKYKFFNNGKSHGFKFFLSPKYEHELEKTLRGTGYEIINL